MTESLLHKQDVASPFVKTGSKAVTERVRRHGLDPRPLAPVREPTRDVSRREATSHLPREQIPLGAPVDPGADTTMCRRRFSTCSAWITRG